jgi:acid phosphatase (class A)
MTAAARPIALVACSVLRRLLPVPWLAVALSGCQSGPPLPPTSPEVVGEFRPGSGYLKGYLDRKQLPNSLALLPPPPREGSPQHGADLATYRDTRALRDQPRWTQAARDANLKFPAAAEVFACALDLPISQEATPHLNMLLRRSLLDAGLATYAAKDHYTRMRPFVAAKEATCTPAEEPALAKDGSYPSGHAALGWGWALILTELAPERTDALLARGHAFGQSRVVCGVHWQSDVDAGRVIGAAAVARLHADPVFLAQAAAARKEIDEARAKGLRATRDCQAEAQALGR